MGPPTKAVVLLPEVTESSHGGVLPFPPPRQQDQPPGDPPSLTRVRGACAPPLLQEAPVTRVRHPWQIMLLLYTLVLETGPDLVHKELCGLDPVWVPGKYDSPSVR